MGGRSLHAALLALIGLPLAGFTFEPATPESQGLSSTALAALSAYSEGFASTTSLMVLRNDRLVWEHHSGSGSADLLYEIKSATKSLGAGLLAKALGEGALALDDVACSTPGITLRQLVTMTSGIVKSNADCDGPYWFTPGSDFAYSDSGVNVFRDALNAAYGADLEPALASILTPIGATTWTWRSNQDFSSGVQMSVAELLRYGRLWLRGGDWDGVQVLPPEAVALALTPSNPALRPDYGMLWWVRGQSEPAFYDRYGFQLDAVFPASAPADAFLAAGCTRAWLLVVPSLGLVAARAGGACESIQSGTTQFTDEARGFVEGVLAAVTRCSDGVDNDGDGLVDHPEDPGCTSAAGTSELPVNVLPTVPALGSAGAALLACGIAAACVRAARGRRPRVAPRNA